MTLDINVVSATGLTEFHSNNSKTKLYVIVSLTDAVNYEQKAQTHVDNDGGGNPTWNFPMIFAVDVDEILKQDLKTRLVFAIKCEDGKGGRDLGEVHVSVAELLQSVVGDGSSMRYVAVSYPVKKPLGKTTAGVLNFEYRFGGSPTSDTPAAGYATKSIDGLYPPQPQGYYYPPPPPAAAGYGGYPPTPYPYYSPYSYPPPSPYPPYYGYPYPPPHPSHVQPPASPVGTQQRSVKDQKKDPKRKFGAKILGAVGALAVGALTGGSVPDFSSLTTSGFDPSAYATSSDFSNLYTLTDPSSALSGGSFTVDYSSFI